MIWSYGDERKRKAFWIYTEGQGDTQ